MAGLSAADVTKLILIYIGGKMLFPVINARLAGGTTTCQGPPTFITNLQSIAKGISAVADTVETTIKTITDPIDKISTAVANVTSAVDKLSAIAENPVGYIQNEVYNNLETYGRNNCEELDSRLAPIAAEAETDLELGQAWNNFKTAVVDGGKKVFRYKSHTDSISTGGAAQNVGTGG